MWMSIEKVNLYLSSNVRKWQYCIPCSRKYCRWIHEWRPPNHQIQLPVKFFLFNSICYSILDTHFLRSTPGAPLLVSPPSLAESFSQSDWVLSPSLFLSVSDEGGLLEPSTLIWVYIGSAWVMGVLDQYTSWLCPSLAPFLCSVH